MAVDILMPALSLGMEKGHLARWLKREGDRVAAGDVIAEIETDKATLELEASEAGILAEIVVPAGSSDVPVNERIAVLSAGGGNAPAPVVETASRASEATDAGETEAPGPMASNRIAASPRARALAAELGVDLADLRGSGPRGRILERNVRDAVAAAMARLRADVGVAPPILRDDVALDEESAVEAFAPPIVSDTRAVAPGYITAHIPIDALLALLERVNEAMPRGVDGVPSDLVTLDDFVTKAWAMALSATPDANLSLRNGAMVRHDHVDIAILRDDASAVPVLRQAERLGIAAIMRETKALAAGALAGTLRADAYTGGATSITRVGLPGIDGIAAALRPTHASALAYGPAGKRVLIRDDAAVVAQALTVTVSLDPRVISVATGAALVGAFRARLEAPASLLV